MSGIESVGIILAAGKGTRFKAQGINKTAAIFNKKPLVWYGWQLYHGLMDKTVVVVGAHAHSVKNAIGIQYDVYYATQKKRLGTGHALKVAFREIEAQKLDPEYIIVGYGDHMMYYKKQFIRQFIKAHKKTKAAISLITTTHLDPNKIAWGRVIREMPSNNVVKIVEQKDATEEERSIIELNAGFYCIDYKFLKKYINKLKKSPITGEYYLPELVEIAIKNDLNINGYEVPFNFVGLGINSMEDLMQNKVIYEETTKKTVRKVIML